MGSQGALTPERLGRLMMAWAGALNAGSMTSSDVANALADLGDSLATGRITVEP